MLQRSGRGYGSKHYVQERSVGEFNGGKYVKERDVLCSGRVVSVV